MKLAPRVMYPQGFPEEAVDDLIAIGGRQTYRVDRALLGKAVWEVIGAAHRIYFGDPNGNRIAASPINIHELCDKLYRCREVLYRALAEVRRQSLGPVNPHGAGVQGANLAGVIQQPDFTMDDIRAFEALLTESLT